MFLNDTKDSMHVSKPLLETRQICLYRSGSE